MEIVSKPDMRSAEEAGAYLRKLRTILRYLGTCDGNMDEGSMRDDVNLSLRRPGGALGTRTERPEAHTSELLSLMRSAYAGFPLTNEQLVCHIILHKTHNTPEEKDDTTSTPDTKHEH